MPKASRDDAKHSASRILAAVSPTASAESCDDPADALGLCRFPRTRLPLSQQGVPSERRPVAPHETGCPTYTVPPQAPAAAPPVAGPACRACGDALDAKALKEWGKTRCTGCGHWAIG